MPWYMTAEDAKREEEIAERFARRYNAKQYKVGVDTSEAYIDRAFEHLGRIRWFAEIKNHHKYEFGECPQFVVSEHKILHCRDLETIVRVPVLLIVEFRCRTLAYLRCLDPYIPRPNWKRRDRDDKPETGACFTWSKFKKV